MKKMTCFVAMGMILAAEAGAGELSRSFELRYFTPDARANGETDFKGETAIFNTDQRVEFLSDYADYAKHFFNDPGLDKLAAPEDQVQAAMGRLKAQPLPKVRDRQLLNGWKWLGYRTGQREADLAVVKAWEQRDGVGVEEGRLVFDQVVDIAEPFDAQDWRLFLQWRVRLSGVTDCAMFVLSDSAANVEAIRVEFKDGRITANGQSAGKYQGGQWVQVKLEVDLAEQRYNVYLDDVMVVDFVELGQKIKQVDTLVMAGEPGVSVDDIWGVGYHQTGIVAQPIKPLTFIDADFEVKPILEGWQGLDYDDSAWGEGDLPLVHGGERYAKEDLYLRKVIEIGEYERAVLEAETLDPTGEVWINGEVVQVSRDRHPFKINITQDLKKNEQNIIAIRVKYFENDPSLFSHSPADPYIGWYAGRMRLDLRGSDYIDDVFIYTNSIGETAEVQAEITVGNEWKQSRFDGTVEVNLYRWYPQESSEIAASGSIPVSVTEWCKDVVKPVISVKNPVLWTYADPQLYKVEVILRDSDGKAVDDDVVTTGIRTVSQEGGMFRINGKPEMLNGVGIFQFLYPMDKIAAWNRCAPLDWLVRQVLMTKNLGGNAMRIHVHAWGHVPPARNINDPRLAEVGDQLGMMFMWPTMGWIRSGTPWGIDFELYAKNMRQVRNHPSIVMWEGCNHPTVKQKYDRKAEGWIKALDKIHETIYSNDKSRLIIPIARFAQISRGAHDWTAANTAWGNMDCQLGNESLWSHLRKWPNSDKWPKDFPAKRLKDPDRAYFCTEHQEAIGQINWHLSRGKPWYKVHSYEWDLDEAVIGRRLTMDEWQQSQAWQALTVWEPIKKMRWLGYDGFFWCCLRGGPNCGTYNKPLIDYMGYAKLAFYAHRMAFQPLVAGSGDVDVAYGPADTINPIVINLGPQRRADVTVQVKDLSGKVLAEKTYPDVTLEGSNSSIRLAGFAPEGIKEGFYAVEYIIADKK